jgi:hypothetical protein
MQLISSRSLGCLIACRRVAMAGQPGAAIARIGEAVTTLIAPKQQHDAVALLMLKAEILALSCRESEALEVFRGEIDHRLLHCPPETSFVAADNRSVLSLALFDTSSGRDFYTQVDLRRLAQFDLWDYEAIALAQEAAASDRHFDAVPLLWRQLLAAHKHGCWRSTSLVANHLANHCLLAGSPEVAAIFAILGRDAKVADRVAESIASVRQRPSTRGTVRRILAGANLLSHAETGARMLAHLADSLPDDDVAKVFDWLMTRCRLSPNNRSGHGPIVEAWKAVGHLCARLEPDQAELVVEAACAHSWWRDFDYPRGDLVRVVNAVLPRLDRSSLLEVVSEVLPLATDRQHELDFAHVLNLLVHAAKLGDPGVSALVREKLYPKGIQSNLRLLRFAGAFGATVDPSSLGPFVAKLAEGLRNQVQHVTGDQPAKPIRTGSFGTFQTSSPQGPTAVVAVLGGATELAVAVAHRMSLAADDVAALIRACLSMISEPDNLLSNKEMLAQVVGEFASAMPAELADEAYAAILAYAKGSIVESQSWFSYAAGQHPMSRFRGGDISPFELQGAALSALASIAQAHPTLHADEIWGVVLTGCTHVSAEVRRPAMAAIGKLAKLQDDATAALLMGTRDNDVDVAQTSYFVLSELLGRESAAIHWHALIHSFARSLQLSDWRLRRAVAKTVNRIGHLAPVGELSDRLETIRSALREDTSFLVRSAMNEHAVSLNHERSVPPPPPSDGTGTLSSTPEEPSEEAAPKQECSEGQ